MTIQELYELIGGNYAAAQQIMRMDKLIDKYIRKLSASKVNEALMAAGAAMDPNGIFESAHAMKGVCANLGLESLFAAASELSEEFRPGTPRHMSDEEVQEKLRLIDGMYQRTAAGIDQYIKG